MSSLTPDIPPRIEVAQTQRVRIGDKLYVVDHGDLDDIAIAANPDENLAHTSFNVPPMEMTAVQSVKGVDKPGEDKTKDRVNAYCYHRYAPQIHGTHTEGRSHILTEVTPAIAHIAGIHFLARLITIDPERAAGQNLSLLGEQDKNDRVITREQVEDALGNDKFTPEVLIIRTPNYPGKKSKKHGGTNPPYPHHDVAELLVDRGVKHIVLDLPSADREKGEVFFHRTFWQDPFSETYGKVLPELAHIPRGQTRDESTITEAAYIGDKNEDGWYLIYLNPISLIGDAAPVRPMIAPIPELN